MEDNFNIVQKKLNHIPLSSAEQLWFDYWYASDENASQFKDYQKVWVFTGQHVKKLNPNVNQQWSKFKTNNFALPKVRNIQRRHWYIVTSVAAVLIVSLFIGVFFKSGITDKKYIALNQRIEILLPDNSTVALNKQSTLIVKGGYSDARNVELQGEAIFNVQKNAEVPFIVEMGNELSVKVLGTQFNVRSIPNAKTVELQVLEGKVQFGTNSDQRFVSKGEQVSYKKSVNEFSEIEPINTNLLAWHTNSLEFNNTPINEVVLSLERYVNKNIEIPKNGGDLRYTGNFSNPSEQEIADILSIAMGWDYKINKNTIIFSNKKIR